MATLSALQNDRDPFAPRRQGMVNDQLASRGIGDVRVLAAMGVVPREKFVPRQFQHAAYEDRPLPIGFGQTISQPYTVAYMAEALQLTGVEKVLEVGTGSGYERRRVVALAQEVHTVERIPSLAQQAITRLKELELDNVHVCAADGTLGLPREAPFDAIVVTAGAANLPNAYLEQLADGGRIVIPIGDSPTVQNLRRFTRLGNQLRSENLGQFVFVPLIGKHSWSDNWRYEE